MKEVVFLGFLFVAQAAAQDVKVMTTAPAGVVREVSSFDVIDPAYELQATSLATLTGFFLNAGQPNAVALFNSFWKKANGVGANAFRIDALTPAGDSTWVTLSVYYLDEEEAKRNLDAYPKNLVYALGDLDRKHPAKSIKLNNKKIALAPLEYVAYQNEVDEETTIAIGGVLGTKVWVRGREGRLPAHFALSGFAVGPNYTTTLGLTFNTGRIYPIGLNVGRFLVQVLKSQN